MKMFSEAVNTAVSGKSLEDVKKLSKIGGASLTTAAFQEALKNM
jgi:hypothetical protein